MCTTWFEQSLFQRVQPLRPGAVRLAVRRSDAAPPEAAARGLMVSAYRAADGETDVVVAVNQEREARRLHHEVDEREGAAAWPPSVTSASKDLAPIPEAPSGDTLSVPARSIVTYVEAGS